MPSQSTKPRSPGIINATKKKKSNWTMFMTEMFIQRPEGKDAKNVYDLSCGHCPCPSLGGNAGVTDCRSEDPSLQRQSSNTYVFLDKLR